MKQQWLERSNCIPASVRQTKMRHRPVVKRSATDFEVNWVTPVSKPMRRQPYLPLFGPITSACKANSEKRASLPYPSSTSRCTNHDQQRSAGGGSAPATAVVHSAQRWFCSESSSTFCWGLPFCALRIHSPIRHGLMIKDRGKRYQRLQAHWCAYFNRCSMLVALLLDVGAIDE